MSHKCACHSLHVRKSGRCMNGDAFMQVDEVEIAFSSHGCHWNHHNGDIITQQQVSLQ